MSPAKDFITLIGDTFASTQGMFSPGELTFPSHDPLFYYSHGSHSIVHMNSYSFKGKTNSSLDWFFSNISTRTYKQ